MSSFQRRATGRNSLVAHLTKLEFGELPLVGRDEELKQLKDAFRGNSNIVGVAGYSGVGKTALIETFTNQVMEHDNDDGCWILKGKYDQQVSSLPYSAIAAALMTLLGGDDDYKQQVQRTLKRTPWMRATFIFSSG